MTRARRFLIENNPQLSRARLELALGIGADHQERPGVDGGRRDRGDALTMSDARTAIGFDRLPWLADEPQPPARAGSRRLIPWVVAAILLVAGASYWIGQQNVREPVAQAPGHPSTTVTLPEAKAPPQPEVTPDRVPEVEPAIVPTVRPGARAAGAAAAFARHGRRRRGRPLLPLRARPNRRRRPSRRQRRRRRARRLR